MVISIVGAEVTASRVSCRPPIQGSFIGQSAILSLVAPRRRSGDEEGVISDCLQALFQREIGIRLHPLSGVPRECEGKTVRAGILETGELRLKRGRDRRWAGAPVGCKKVEIASVPFRINVHYVVEPIVVWRRLDVERLQHRLDELARPGLYVRLDR